MKLKELAKVLAIIIGVGALASCSTGRKHQGEDYAYNDTAADDASDDAQATGAGDTDRIKGHGNQQLSSAKRTYYFDFDSNVVRDSDKPAIEANANKIASSARKVMLQGHTDPRGSREYNIGLGERRAKAVADVMRENGANPDQIRLVSYGAEKPAAPGRSEQDYQLDRRVVLQDVK